MPGHPIRAIIEGLGRQDYYTFGNGAVGFCQLGGHSGPISFPEQLEDYATRPPGDVGLGIGSGSIVVMDETWTWLPTSKGHGFFAHESCGKCTPLPPWHHPDAGSCSPPLRRTEPSPATWRLGAWRTTWPATLLLRPGPVADKALKKKAA